MLGSALSAPCEPTPAIFSQIACMFFDINAHIVKDIIFDIMYGRRNHIGSDHNYEEPEVLSVGAFCAALAKRCEKRCLTAKPNAPRLFI